MLARVLDNVASFTQHKLQECQSHFRDCRQGNEPQLSSFHDRRYDGFASNFKNGLNFRHESDIFHCVHCNTDAYQKLIFSLLPLEY